MTLSAEPMKVQGNVLNKIDDLPLPTQVRLLSVLDDLNIEIEQMPPFYGFRWIMAATNHDLEKRTLIGECRHDLLARFKRRVELPPLVKRREEIPQLAEFAAQQPDANATRAGDQLAVTDISEAATQSLCEEDDREGNFRELEEVVHQACTTRGCVATECSTVTTCALARA